MEEWTDGLGELGVVVVVRPVPAGSGRDVPAEPCGEPVSDFVEEGQALLADEKSNRPPDRRPHLVVWQGQLIQ